MKNFIKNEIGLAILCLLLLIVLPSANLLIQKAEASQVFHLLDRNRLDGIELFSLFENKNLFELPVKLGEDYKSERASYAYDISNGDKDFVLTLNAENGAWTHDSRHMKPYKLCWTWNHWNIGVLPNQMTCNGFKSREIFYKTHYDYGFCGMSDGYKKHIVDDPRFLTDWKWQIRECYNEYKAGTTFYGYFKRHARGKNVKFTN